MTNVSSVYGSKRSDQQTGRPKAGYRNAAGKRVPGVTTICKHVDPSADGLINWAVNLALEGKDHRVERDRAAAEGTSVHDAVALVCQGASVANAVQSFDDDKRDAVASGLEAFVAWQAQSHIRVEPFEIPLVSEDYQFGGTADLIGYDESGGLHLADIKSGKLYPSAVLQVAAYRHLVEVELSKPVVGVHLLRFDRVEGAFTHVQVPQPLMEEAWSGFLQCLDLYRLNQRLRKAL